MHSCTIELTGVRPISKKNSKRLIMRGRSKFLVPSVAYENFEKIALNEISKQITSDFETITGPVQAIYSFILKGRLKADVDNLMASVNDIAQKAGIIADDDQIVTGAFTKDQGEEWFFKVTYNEIEKDPLTNNTLS